MNPSSKRIRIEDSLDKENDEARGQPETQSSFPSALGSDLTAACDSAAAASHSYQLIPVQGRRSGTVGPLIQQRDKLPLNGEERGTGASEKRPADKLGTAAGLQECTRRRRLRWPDVHTPHLKGELC